LTQDAEVTVWNEGFFGVGSTFIETLVNALPRFDFAVLVLTPDDLVNSRDVEMLSPRDNVLFDLKQYFYITTQGQEYLKLRGEMMQNIWEE
jgi:predicted nucleotide-binding protein